MGMIIKNAKIITWNQPNQVLLKHAMKITDGVIVDLDTEENILNQIGRASCRERV